MATYFVTGATGFIGRNLLERLLERKGDIHVLVREGSLERLGEIVGRLGGEGRVHPVIGDLQADKLGVEQAWIDEHRGKVDHVFHLAAIYDMAASEERNEALNVGGTQALVNLANDLKPGILHHVSSIAVAGQHRGRLLEQPGRRQLLELERARLGIGEEVGDQALQAADLGPGDRQQTMSRAGRG